MAHGNSKKAMLMRLIDLNNWLAETPEGQQAEYYKQEIALLMKRVYG